MAAKNKADDVVARGADVPLALAATGARDALVDPRETDYIPDLDTKGLHVGEVRQPAEPVLHRGGDVTFESSDEAGESKFAPVTYAEQLAANDEWQKGRPEYEGRVSAPIETDPDRVARAKAAMSSGRTATRATATAEAPGE